MNGQRDTSPPPAAPVTNWERQCVTLAGYCYAVMHWMKVQLVTPYRVGLLQRYGITVRGNVTSVYPPLFVALLLKKQHGLTISEGYLWLELGTEEV